MANLIGTIQSLIQVGVSGSTPEVNQRFLGITPTSTMVSKGKKKAAAGVAADLNMGGIGNAVLVFLSFTDISTGAAKKTTVKVNTEGAATATEILPGLTQFLYIGDDTAKGIEIINITPGSGNDTIIDFIIVGVA